MYKDFWESSVAKITQTSGSVFTLSFVQVLYTNPAFLACEAQKGLAILSNITKLKNSVELILSNPVHLWISNTAMVSMSMT